MKFHKGEWERTLPDGKQILNLNTKRGLDTYLERTHEMRARQNNMCPWCGLFMRKDDTTFDHQRGRGAGKRDDRIVIDGKPFNNALHYKCNGEKGSQPMRDTPEFSAPDYYDVP